MVKWWEEPGRINNDEGEAWYPGHWYTGIGNILTAVRDTMPNIPDDVIVKDDTVREGEECPNHKPINPEMKVKLATELFEAGVNEAEVGFVGTLESHAEFANLLRDALPEMKQSAHTGRKGTWKESYDAVADAGVDVLYSLLNVTDYGLKNLDYIRKDHVMEDLITNTYERVEYAKSRGLIVRIGVGTPQTNPLDRTIQCWKAMLDAGCDRLHISDGHGICIPESTKFYTKLGNTLIDLCGRKGKTKIANHCHDDYGMADVNMIASVTEGCEIIDLSMNGMGDRGGLADYNIVIPNLEIQYGVSTGFKMDRLCSISSMVEEMWGIPVPYNYGVVGRNMFTHEEDPHIAAVLRGREGVDSWKRQSPMNPAVVGAKERLQFSLTSVHKGPQSCLAILSRQLGYEFTDKQMDELIKYVLDTSDKKHFATEEEVTVFIKENFTRIKK